MVAAAAYATALKSNSYDLAMIIFRLYSNIQQFYPSLPGPTKKVCVGYS